MSCKSCLYAANTNTQAVAVNGVISFGNVVRRFGNNVGISGGNVIMNGAGYYDIDTNITFADTAAGTATIQLYANGTAIPGALAQITTGTANAVHSISIPAVVRNTCCADNIITAVVTGVAISVTNAAIVVEKI